MTLGRQPRNSVRVRFHGQSKFRGIHQSASKQALQVPARLHGRIPSHVPKRQPVLRTNKMYPQLRVIARHRQRIKIDFTRHELVGLTEFGAESKMLGVVQLDRPAYNLTATLYANGFCPLKDIPRLWCQLYVRAIFRLGLKRPADKPVVLIIPHHVPRVSLCGCNQGVGKLPGHGRYNPDNKVASGNVQRLGLIECNRNGLSVLVIRRIQAGRAR